MANKWRSETPKQLILGKQEAEELVARLRPRNLGYTIEAVQVNGGYAIEKRRGDPYGSGGGWVYRLH